MAVRRLTLIILTLAILALPGAGRASLRTCDALFSATSSQSASHFDFKDPALSLHGTDVRSSVFLGAGTESPLSGIQTSDDPLGAETGLSSSAAFLHHDDQLPPPVARCMTY